MSAALPQRPPRTRVREPLPADPPPVEESAKRPREGEDAARVAWRPDAAEPDVGNCAYHDHTADIQCHGWGASVEEAFGWTALCMMNYMTPLAGFASEPLHATHEFHVKGHDMHTLLFAFLDELLFVFSTEFFVARELRLCAIDRTPDAWSLRCTGTGSRFVPGTHEQGTEVKAITYSAMQVHERAPGEGPEGSHPAEVFVIVDI